MNARICAENKGKEGPALLWENGNTDAGEGKEVRGTGRRKKLGKRENRKKEKLDKDVGTGGRRRWVGVREGGGRVINNLDHYGQFIIGAFCFYVKASSRLSSHQNSQNGAYSILYTPT